MNNKINLPATLKQYNLDTNKMSTTIPKKEAKNLAKNLSIKSILQNLSLPATKTNQAIISQLLDHEIPLNQQLISELNDFISKLTTKDNLATKTKIALLLKKINMPLNQKFYNFFKNYIFSATDLKNNIKQLLNQLDIPTNNLSNNQNPAQHDQQNQSSSSQSSSIDPESLNKSFTSNLNNKLSQDNLNLSQTKLDTLLQKLNLDPTKENRQIIKKMFDFKLKITADNFQKIKTAQNKNEQSLLKLLFSQKLNLDKQNLLNQFDFKATSKLDSSFLKLSQALINQDSSPQQLTAKIKKLLAEEPQLLLKLKENFSAPEFKKLSTKLNLPQTEQQQLLKQGLKNEILDTIITTNNLDSNAIQNSINKLNSGHDNQLVKFLFQLSQETSASEVQEKTEDLAKKLLNLTAVNYETEHTLLFLPVLFQEGLELAQIKFDQQQSTTTKDKSFKFSFKVDTTNLGPLEVKVKIKNKQLNILFLVNNPDSKELMEKNLNSLKKAFMQHEYKINYLNCKLQQTETAKQDQEETTLTTIYYTI